MNARAEIALRHTERLEHDLGVIREWLQEPNVIEIMLNPDGYLWVECAGRAPECRGQMPWHQAETLMKTLAALKGAVLDQRNPVIECTLPFDGSRFSGTIEPVSPPSFNIRRRALKIFSLGEYVESGAISDQQAAILRRAIAARRNIVVVGGTGSGKTTLANALIAEIAVVHPAHRLVIIEDTPEIQCASKNVVYMWTSENFDIQRALRVTMRRRPDRIIVGEVRGGEARTLIEAWNTGHAGGIATVHANNARAGLHRLQSLCALGGAPQMQEFIGEAVDVLVFISNTDAGRRVEEIVAVKGYAHGAYHFSQPETNDA